MPSIHNPRLDMGNSAGSKINTCLMVVSAEPERQTHNHPCLRITRLSQWTEHVSAGWISVQEDRSGTASRGQTDELSLKVTMAHNNWGYRRCQDHPNGRD